MVDALGNSTQEQELLRAIALWAADCAEQAVRIFEGRVPDDPRPRAAVEAARAFGRGARRDQQLRIVALAAMRAGRGTDDPCRHAARAATLTAAVAYTHTDLQTGLPGVRQARHVLGPVVHTALACRSADGPDVGDDVMSRAVQTAPEAVSRVLAYLPRQPAGHNPVDRRFAELDAALRAPR
ncbi:exonuclease SbcC [Mycobacterium sp. PS03-16]|uniref:putative immunity protein n=1 Tax=Mycobacterium sp. PS03-16 TaxID=2559611 RepID=UPI001073F4B8|nr:exonuclease SbcC [Mycobacterium sp. PS03-16]TFV56490.1 exonuclease SbcC [Mycobacterium sp. PS03-16]